MKGPHKSTIRSSYPGIFRYTGERGSFHPNPFDWLKVKSRDDDIGGLWRVHDKLYDLKDFAKTHPGGKEWIEHTRGLDITEAFESSHFINLKNVEQTLSKFYVGNATTPRNSPYTFDERNFYKTLKRKAEPILKQLGMQPSQEAVFIQDSLVFLYLATALIGVMMNSKVILILAGVFLGMSMVAAHNFFHKKNNWRMYYFDLSTLSSYEWRISHAISHHLYPNTILDFEILLGEPVVEMLPVRPKLFSHKYIVPYIIDTLYAIFGPLEVLFRAAAIWKGKQKFRPENLIVILELLILMWLAQNISSGLKAWMIITSASTFWFGFVSNNSAHHHPHCFHDGDESRPDPDFGLCQLDATASKSDWYHRSLFSVMTTFGEHPLHHLFPTVCHGKLKYLKPILEETLMEFSEEILEFTQLQLFVGTHRQLYRSDTYKFGKANEK